MQENLQESILQQHLLSASTIDDGGLTVKANIAYKEVIKKLATGSMVTAAGCDFNPTSSVTLNRKNYTACRVTSKFTTL